MALDDLYAIAVVAALLVFSVGITLFVQRRKPLFGAQQSANGGTSSTATDEELENDVEQVFTVTFQESGQQHPWNPEEESLLSFAESLGIEVESQCRAGECGSCRTKLISGALEYHKQPSINPGRGHCLLCVSIPNSDITLSR